MPYAIARAARLEMAAIWKYVFEESGSEATADRVATEIADKFVFLAGFPWAGRDRSKEARPGVRSFPVRRYIILYRIETSGIRILRVIHGSRDLEQIFLREL